LAAYLELYRTGKLRERVRATISLLESYSVCPHSCDVNRVAGDAGKCHTMTGIAEDEEGNSG